MTNRIHITAPLAGSLAFLALLAIVAAVNLWSVVTAALGPGLGENEATAELQLYETEHLEKLDRYRAQFDGRSIFRTPNPTPQPLPPPPPITRPQPEQVRTPEPRDEGPPPPPATYGGRAILFVVGDEVWFEDSTKPFRVRKGETVNDITIMDVNAPKYVKIGWRRGEYEVPIFDDWNTSVGLRTTPAPKRPVPGLVEQPATPPSGLGADHNARARAAAANLLGNTTKDSDVQPAASPSLSNEQNSAKSDKPKEGPPE